MELSGHCLWAVRRENGVSNHFWRVASRYLFPLPTCHSLSIDPLWPWTFAPPTQNVATLERENPFIPESKEGNMNATKIQEMALASLSGTLPFPEIVRNLLAEGVEYYHVDYVKLQFSFYGIEGDVVVASLTLDQLPAIATEFNVDALRAAIVDSQRHGQKFPRFCARAMEAGVQGYYAFLRGKRVTYFGRTGDQHVEWFPGAQPKEER